MRRAADPFGNLGKAPRSRDVHSPPAINRVSLLGGTGHIRRTYGDQNGGLCRA